VALPGGGEAADALIVTVESSAELWAFSVEDPGLLPIDRLQASTRGRSVFLEWRSWGSYEYVHVFREGELLSTLPGDAVSYEDSAPPEGVLDYEVVAVRGECSSRAAVRAVVGAGQVLASVPFDGEWAVDITEDAQEFLWVSDVKNRIFIYDKELGLVTSFDGPFLAEDDETTGIAFDSSTGIVFVYNATTNEVAGINDLGEVVVAPFPSGVPSDPDDEAVVTSMLFNPLGAGGAGSFWYLDVTTATIQQRDRAGLLIGSCIHPDQRAEPPPPATSLDALTFGIAEAPGTGFAELYASGGKVRDDRATRILKISATSCEPLGEEIPSDGLALEGPAFALGIHWTTHGGRPALYVVESAFKRSRLLEVEVEPPPVPAVRDLAASQPGPAQDVRITFTNPGGLDALEIQRDGVLVASLGGDATEYVDVAAPEGLVEYEVRGVHGGERGDDRSCRVEVGRGSIAAREFAGGLTSLHSLASDPVTGGYVAASNSTSYSNDIHRFGEDLRYIGAVPSPFRFPAQIAALAVRDAGGKSELACLGWLPGAQPGEQPQLPLRYVTPEGLLVRQASVTPPPPRNGFVTFPSGMAWDRATDTLWYLERNAEAIVNIDLDGTELRVLPHPARLHQDGVQNFGLAVDSSRGVLLVATAGRYEHQVTRVVEATLRGDLTGVEVGIGPPFYDRPGGFAMGPGGFDLVVAAGSGGVWDLVRRRVFGPVAGVEGLTCEPVGEGSESVRLAWRNGESFDEVAVYRGENLVATLDGASVEWIDDAGAGPEAFYRVAGRSHGFEGPSAVCYPNASAKFLRGDVEENGIVNITDAIAVLVYLFSGGGGPIRCLDAADVNDTGDINITDAVALLGFLFLSGPPPALPFPSPGSDPTEDELACGSR
jgi:sugar lactone lactonase YvrE